MKTENKILIHFIIDCLNGPSVSSPCSIILKYNYFHCVIISIFIRNNIKKSASL
jgi:hypothetical protein